MQFPVKTIQADIHRKRHPPDIMEKYGTQRIPYFFICKTEGFSP